MKKVIKAVQTGKAKWQRRIYFELSKDEIAGCVIFALTIGWVLFQVVRSC